MTRLRVKICGITRLQDAELAIDAGADAIGIVLAESRRQRSTAQAAAIFASVPPSLGRIAVLRHPSEQEATDAFELMGSAVFQSDAIDFAPSGTLAKTPESQCIPVFRDSDDLRKELSAHCKQCAARRPLVLIEGPKSGAGQTPNWNRITDAIANLPLRVMLAGGLAPENVGEAVRIVRPFAIDVASGVEVVGSPGIKDPKRLLDFFAAAREADRSLAATATPPPSN